MTCKARQENNGVCPHHNLHCGWPDCDRKPIFTPPKMQPCAGRNCGSTNPNLHSAECFEDYEKSTGMAQPVAPNCGAIIEVFGKDWRLEYMSLPVGKHRLYTQQYTYTAPPQRKPVAWGVFEGNLHDMFFTEAEAVEMAQLKGTHAEVKPLYTKENS